ncbi:hypothetical protein BRC77_01325 [Halobacteriales archaeon QH_8_64_26]|nr:MAG: hypothetical protein BRC77_01325 [Halobacteriales archaeon QH_8_64_26]
MEVSLLDDDVRKGFGDERKPIRYTPAANRSVGAATNPTCVTAQLPQVTSSAASPRRVPVSSIRRARRRLAKQAIAAIIKTPLYPIAAIEPIG